MIESFLVRGHNLEDSTSCETIKKSKYDYGNMLSDNIVLSDIILSDNIIYQRTTLSDDVLSVTTMLYNLITCCPLITS
jgi:hypothetical protein